jgi:colicin import membrane protein
MSSEYEYIVAELLVKERKRLEELQKNAEKNKSEIEELTNRLSTTQSLFENYNMGMNYFRRAKGGRSGLRE